MSGVLIADFTVGYLANHLAADDAAPQIEATVAPGLAVMASLNELALRPSESPPSFAVVWSRPEATSATFAARLELMPASIDAALDEVDVFVDAVRRLSARVPLVFVPTWTMPPRTNGSGPLDMRVDVGVGGMLARMNDRLVAGLSSVGGVFVLDTQRWVALSGPPNPTLWYTAKVPFASQVFKLAAQDIKAAVAASRGMTRKLLVLDLDNTLWGGVVGEVGWEHVRLGGHDPIGEAFVDFQRAVKRLGRRGVVLALVSKNDEARALEGMQRHPEMLIRPSDLAAFRINWEDKAKNIADLVGELNLGIDSVVFIDDHPAERARVREALPAVLVPEWPADPMRYTEALAALRCFDTLALTSEDGDRNSMYAAERERKRVRENVGSIDDWLRSLATKVTVELLSDSNFDRTLQLINKTNQMNLRTRRIDRDELEAWRADPRKRLWTFRVADRFGDAGLVGVASLEHDQRHGKVTDFLLSCRVFGRHVEHTMLAVVLEQAATLRLETVELAYVPTPKNGVTRTFLDESGLNEDSGKFLWRSGETRPIPAFIELMWV